MAYTLKPGQGSLFKNDRKESATHPDYKGSVVGPDGAEFWIDGWKKQSKDGKAWLSLSIKPKSSAGGKSTNNKVPFNDEIGF